LQSPGINDFSFGGWGSILNQFFFIIISALTIIAGITPKGSLGKLLVGIGMRGETGHPLHFGHVDELALADGLAQQRQYDLTYHLI